MTSEMKQITDHRPGFARYKSFSTDNGIESKTLSSETREKLPRRNSSSLGLRRKQLSDSISEVFPDQFVANSEKTSGKSKEATVLQSAIPKKFLA